MQLIEQALVREVGDALEALWERVKYQQAELFTLTHKLNSMNEWNVLRRRGYRK